MKPLVYTWHLQLFLSWSTRKKTNKLLYTPLSLWSLFHTKDVITSTTGVERMILEMSQLFISWIILYWFTTIFLNMTLIMSICYSFFYWRNVGIQSYTLYYYICILNEPCISFEKVKESTNCKSKREYPCQVLFSFLFIKLGWQNSILRSCSILYRAICKPNSENKIKMEATYQFFFLKKHYFFDKKKKKHY